MDHLKEFELQEVLSTDAATKSQVLLGTIRAEPCLIKLSRLPLPELQPGKLPIGDLHKLETNDIYSWGTGSLVESGGNCYFDVVYPATETHIAKYRVSPKHSITETPEMYDTVVAPYIESQRESRLDWVRAILHEGAEADRVLYRDDDFILLPNSKWDRKNVDSLYMLVLVMADNIASVRDLTAAHIPLLEHIRDTSRSVIAKQYGLSKSQIKTYFHYQPSYYHLHVHIANVELRQDDFGKSLLLDNVIDMIRSKPMKEHSITYFLAESHAMYEKFKQEFPESL